MSATVLLERRGYLMDFRVLYFLPCRPTVSCLPPHPLRLSQAIRAVSSSCDSLWTSSVWTMPASAAHHVKSRCAQYPGSKIRRFPVPDDKVDWSQNWPNYDPVDYTDLIVAKKPVWADPDIG